MEKDAKKEKGRVELKKRKIEKGIESPKRGREEKERMEFIKKSKEKEERKEKMKNERSRENDKKPKRRKGRGRPLHRTLITS